MKMNPARKTGGRVALVICNGEVLSMEGIEPLLQEKPFIVCADGGANKARKLGIRPDVIIGDLDSISPSTRSYYSRVTTIRVESQESTDLEKALDYLLKRRHLNVIVVGAMGGRPDHSYANFSILKKYHRRMRVLFSDSLCDVRVLEKKNTFDLPVGSVVSLMPLGRCDGITTKGLEFSLSNESLELGVREGTSNRVVASPVKISVRKGSLLFFIVKV
jgi:thiamine pyrophosphokinase